MRSALQKFVAVGASWTLSAGMALSQVAKPENKATGPSGSDFMNDMATWFTNHKGAAVVFGVGALVVIGMIIYNRARPGA